MPQPAQKPSGFRNFLGRVVDRALPGTQYNAQTGRYQNILTGILGAGATGAASFFGGPVAGQAARRLAGWAVDRFDGDPSTHTGLIGRGIPSGPVGAVERQRIDAYNPGVSVPNLGFTGGMQIGRPVVDPSGNVNYGGVQLGAYNPSGAFANNEASARSRMAAREAAAMAAIQARINGASGTPASGGVRSGFTFNGYGSPAHRQAVISATQDALRQAQAATDSASRRQIANHAR